VRPTVATMPVADQVGEGHPPRCDVISITQAI
jgi:hypothetical protein